MFALLRLTASISLSVALYVPCSQAMEKDDEPGVTVGAQLSQAQVNSSSVRGKSFYAKGVLALEQSEQDLSRQSELLEEACSHFKCFYENQRMRLRMLCIV